MALLACPSCPAALEARAIALADGLPHLWFAVLPFAANALVLRAIVRWLAHRAEVPDA